MPDTLLNWLDRFAVLTDSGTLQTSFKLALFYLGGLWLSIVIWVTRDAIHRSANIAFQILAILLNIFLPVFGLVIYLILRPEKTLLEKYHEDLEYRMLEGGDDLCFSCGSVVKESFSFCPQCAEEIRQECEECGKSFSRRWKICPYCGHKQEEEKKKPKKTKKRSSSPKKKS